MRYRARVRPRSSRTPSSDSSHSWVSSGSVSGSWLGIPFRMGPASSRLVTVVLSRLAVHLRPGSGRPGAAAPGCDAADPSCPSCCGQSHLGQAGAMESTLVEIRTGDREQVVDLTARAEEL